MKKFILLAIICIAGFSCKDAELERQTQALDRVWSAESYSLHYYLSIKTGKVLEIKKVEQVFIDKYGAALIHTTIATPKNNVMTVMAHMYIVAINLNGEWVLKSSAIRVEGEKAPPKDPAEDYPENQKSKKQETDGIRPLWYTE